MIFSRLLCFAASQRSGTLCLDAYAFAPAQFSLAANGLDPGYIFLQRSKFVQTFSLSCRQLKSQAKHLFCHFALLSLQFVVGQLSDFFGFHRYSCPIRDTNFVWMGSLLAARRIASRATSSLTPSISKITLPGRTTATQNSGAPFPFPMRVSAGFLVTGLSGNKRIQILPPRLMKRVMAIRPASICRSEIHPGSITFSPNSPNAICEPRQALPRMRPCCCLRYFTFLGINMVLLSPTH